MKKKFLLILVSILISSISFAQNEKIPIDGNIFSYTKNDSNKNIEINPRISPENYFKISDVKIDGVFEQTYGYPKITNLKRTDKNTFDEVGIVTRPDSKKNISAYSDILKVSFKITAIKNIKLKNLSFKFASQSDYNSTKVEIKLNNGKTQKLSGTEGVVINANYNLTKFSLKPQDTAEITIHGFYTTDMTNKSCNTVINNLYITAEYEEEELNLSELEKVLNNNKDESKVFYIPVRTYDITNLPVSTDSFSITFNKEYPSYLEIQNKLTSYGIEKAFVYLFLKDKKRKTYEIADVTFIDEYQKKSVSLANGEENLKTANSKKGLGFYSDKELEIQRKKNESAGFGKITDAEKENQRKANEAAGYGRITDEEKENQIKSNEAAGLGHLTDSEVESERTKNEAAGYGRYTHYQIEQQCEKNKEAGLGSIPDTLIEKQRNENEAAGYGRLTDSEVEKLLEQERKANEAAGKGRLTNEEVRIVEIEKKLKEVDFAMKSKKIFHAFMMLADLMSENLSEEYKEKYDTLRKSIENGDPGIGTFDDFSRYDDWILLLKDVELYYTEHPYYMPKVVSVKKGLADKTTRTYTYAVKLEYKKEHTNLDIVKKGLNKVWDSSWIDVPSNWPKVSIHNKNYNKRKLRNEDLCIYEKTNSHIINKIPMIEFIMPVDRSLKELQNLITKGEQALKQAQWNLEHSSGMEQFRYLGQIAGLQETYNPAKAKYDKIRETGATYLSTGLVPSAMAYKDNPYAYSIVLKIVDLQGKTLLKGIKQSLNLDCEFTKISPEIANKLESNEAKVVIDSVYLKYGSINENSADVKSDFEKLQEIEIKQ